MIKIDLWYGNTLDDVAYIDHYFCDLDCVHRGNMYDADGIPIGDYSTTDSLELERTFNYRFD